MISHRTNSFDTRHADRNRPAMRKLAAFVELSPEAIDLLDLLHARCRAIPRGQDIILEGEVNEVAFILEDGWACRYKLLPDGRRQILAFVLPGDFVGVNSHLSQTADDSFVVLSRATVCPFSSKVLPHIRRRHPRLTAAIDWALMQDQAMLGERLLSVGRRNAVESMAHLLLELHGRLALVGLADGNSFELPVTQGDIADALGLTVVHVNRTLRHMREARLATIKHQRVTLHDRATLVDLAGFDPLQALSRRPKLGPGRGNGGLPRYAESAQDWHVSGGESGRCGAGEL